MPEVDESLRRLDGRGQGTLPRLTIGRDNLAFMRYMAWSARCSNSSALDPPCGYVDSPMAAVKCCSWPLIQ